MLCCCLLFVKYRLQDIRIKPLHGWLLLIQIAGALIAYFQLCRVNKILAEGVMVCIICPTATAAAVVTLKLGGNIASVAIIHIAWQYRAGYCSSFIFPLLKSELMLVFGVLF